MLRSSLRSPRMLSGTNLLAASSRQWVIAASRGARLPGLRSFADETKAVGQKNAQKAGPASLSKPQPTTTIDDVGESTVLQAKVPPSSPSQSPPPPQPSYQKPRAAKRSFLSRMRRLLVSLIVLGAVGFGGGVWYSRINDDFHDFFTEYVPFGENAVLYLEELDMRKRFPSTTSHNQKPRREADQPIKIPAQSGASWRVADQGEPAGRQTNASSAAQATTAKPSPKTTPEKSTKPSRAEHPGAGADPAPAKPAEKATPQPTQKPAETQKPAKTQKPEAKSSAGFKAPEVNEPSRFPPLEPIDLMTLPDAKEPLVRDLVRMLNDLILVINANGAHGRYGTTVNKAKSDIAKVGDRIKAIKDEVEKKAAGEVKSSIAEFDRAATALLQRVEGTLVAQEAEWRKEFEEEMQTMRERYDERVKLLLEREKKLNEEKLNNQLLEQALALEKDFAKDIKKQVEQERKGRLSKIDELSSEVSRLERLMGGWNEVVDANLKTQQLHVAVEAVRASLEDAQHPRPFVRELVALKEIADDDAVIDAAIASVKPAAYQRGITTPAQLVDRFRRVAGEVRKASLLPEEAGVASHASSWLLSHVMFKKQGLAEGSDVESILTRTQTHLEEGNLDAAAREMNELKGWARTLSKDWLGELRKVLEVQQALDVIATEARLQSLRVDRK